METDKFGEDNEVTDSTVEPIKPVKSEEGGRVASNITTSTDQPVAVTHSTRRKKPDFRKLTKARAHERTEKVADM